MVNWRKDLQIKFWILLIFAAFFVGIGRPSAIAQTKGDMERFYKGATLNLLVPRATGGILDIWGRMLAPLLEKHTGAKVLVGNMPGAGNLVGGSNLYSSVKPDGLNIAICQMFGMIMGEMLDYEEVKYELDKFTYIGRLGVTRRCCVASKASGYKSFADMQKASKTIRFGGVDPISQSTIEAAIISEAAGLNAKIVTGYKGNKEHILATVAGRELDADCTGTADFTEYIDRNEVTLITSIDNKRNPVRPQTPTVLEIPGLKPEGKKLLELLVHIQQGGYMIIAPPGLPETKRLYLEKALLDALKEPAALEFSRKINFVMSSLPGKECKELILKLAEILPKAERPKLKEILSKRL